MHLKVEGRGESLLLLFVFHCIDHIPIYRYLNTEQAFKLQGKVTFVIHSHYKSEQNSRSALLKVLEETFQCYVKRRFYLYGSTINAFFKNVCCNDG